MAQPVGPRVAVDWNGDNVREQAALLAATLKSQADAAIAGTAEVAGRCMTSAVDGSVEGSTLLSAAASKQALYSCGESLSSVDPLIDTARDAAAAAAKGYILPKVGNAVDSAAQGSRACAHGSIDSSVGASASVISLFASGNPRA